VAIDTNIALMIDSSALTTLALFPHPILLPFLAGSHDDRITGATIAPVNNNSWRVALS